jgi:hypothetical protein
MPFFYINESIAFIHRDTDTPMPPSHLLPPLSQSPFKAAPTDLNHDPPF